MLHLYDRATMAAALTMELEPRLKALLTARIEALAPDLIVWTEYLVVEATDTEADIMRAVGFSPLIDPIDGERFGAPSFQPGWDLLTGHDGWFEMIYTFGSTFAYILLVENDATSISAMCRSYAAAY